jgi:hypothetical protein
MINKFNYKSNQDYEGPKSKWLEQINEVILLNIMEMKHHMIHTGELKEILIYAEESELDLIKDDEFRIKSLPPIQKIITSDRMNNKILLELTFEKKEEKWDYHKEYQIETAHILRTKLKYDIQIENINENPRRKKE